MSYEDDARNNAARSVGLRIKEGLEQLAKSVDRLAAALERQQPRETTCDCCGAELTATVKVEKSIRCLTCFTAGCTPWEKRCEMSKSESGR